MHLAWQAQYKRHVHQRCHEAIFWFAKMICVTGAALRIYPLESPWGGPAPQKAARLAVFQRGLTPRIPLLNHFQWIKSQAPSIAFVNRKFLLTLNLDRVAMSLKHVGPSKMTKGRAPQNILNMLWICHGYMFGL